MGLDYLLIEIFFFLIHNFIFWLDVQVIWLDKQDKDLANLPDTVGKQLVLEF